MSTKFTLLVIITLSLLIFIQCKEGNVRDKPSLEQQDGGMADSISNILAKSNLGLSIYENTTRSNMIKQQLNQKDDMMMRFNYAKELLNMGKTEDAISIISSIINMRDQLKNVTADSKVLHEFLAICYLRIGEQENCQHNHNDDSCIIPIQEKGIHIKEMGSQKAIEKYLELLHVFPDDYQSRWLLNLAYMTLDKYPADVPKKFLIPIEEKNTSNAFQNIASQTGIDMFDLSGGVITDDFNNDGFIDIMTSSWGLNGKIKFYANRGAQGFVDETQIAGLDKIKGGLNLKQADVDNDGDLDFIVLRGGWRPLREWGVLPNSLMINRGDGKFDDKTVQRGMYSVNPTQSAEWFDFNNDGWIDLFIANETTASSTEKFPCELFLNNKSGGFTNIASKANAAVVGYFKGINSGDINNDGHKDIFISNLKGQNVLLQNKGDGTFQNITQSAGVGMPFAAFPCWFFDANNDGWDDLYVASYDEIAFLDQSGQFARDMIEESVTSEAPRIFINNQNNGFTDNTKSYLEYTALSTMGSNYGDVDNDGFLDFYLGTGAPDYRSVVPNRFFRNKNGNSFEDKTFEFGLGHIQKGHGIAFADLNNDGHQDIYAVMGGAFEGDIFPNALFENPGTDNNWIKLKLIGTQSNRSAIGAKLELVCDIDGNERSIFYTINSGGSFGANSLEAHIGLGKASSIKKLLVRWPNKQFSTSEFESLKMNSTYRIKEGNTEAEELELNTFQFSKKEATGHKHHH